MIIEYDRSIYTDEDGENDDDDDMCHQSNVDGSS
jgi:hypothetical protein